jgi:hypothetical protein
MRIKLHPRFAPLDPATNLATLRVWLGVFGVTAAPALKWAIDGFEVVPTALRPLQSVRADAFLAAGEPHAFNGVFDFAGFPPGTVHGLTVRVDDGTVAGLLETIEIATLPAEVPSGFDYFNVMLVSCFDSETDPTGLASSVTLDQLKSTLRPHLTIMAGDQVYLDMPPIKNFPDEEKWLAQHFEEAYTHNWIDENGYRGVLGIAPTVSIPDDHEFWNNAPNGSPLIQNSFTPEGRDRWRRAAETNFKAFQLNSPDEYGKPVIIDVHPLSFFIADTRTHKAEDRSVTLDDATKTALKQWVDRVAQSDSFGIFVSGQSLFSAKAGWLVGRIEDYELPNYGDYNEIMQILAGFTTHRRPLVCLTGDVHFGRVATATAAGTQQPAIYEVISSPTSLVYFPGKDQIKETFWKAAGWLGHPEPWPKHSDPAKVPDQLAPQALPGVYTHCDTIKGQRGNQVALLRFRQVNGGVGMTVHFYPLHGDPNLREPVTVKEITLASL